jgi:hypothetical protein
MHLLQLIGGTKVDRIDLWDVVALETPTNTYHHFLCLCGWSVGPEKGRICTVEN